MTRYEYFSDLWAQGDVYVVVMLNHTGVVVPEFIRAQGKETETFVLGLAPSPKLTADEEGITAPMRFNSYFFDCFFPWGGILALLNDDVQIAFKPSEGPKPAPAPKPVPEKTKKSKPAKSDKVVPLRRIK